MKLQTGALCLEITITSLKRNHNSNYHVEITINQFDPNMTIPVQRQYIKHKLIYLIVSYIFQIKRGSIGGKFYM